MAVAKNVFAVTLGLLGVSAGCVDRTPPPPDAPIPPRSGLVRQEDPAKPMPRPGEDDGVGDDSAGALPPPPYNDVPLVSQETPEQPAFVQAYNAVGRPRIIVFVNRTLDGEMLPVEPEVRPNGAADYGDRSRDSYLRPGQYEAADARQIDYEAIENILTDWLAAGGRTEVISPIAVRQRLTGEQVTDLQTGRPRVMGEVARRLDADVLVHVMARPTRQTQRGLEVRLVAEAINLGQGGQSIGRSVVDIPPPLDKPRINRFTRFLARGLMDRMTGTWENVPPRPREDGRGRAEPRPTGDAVEDAVGEAVAPRGSAPVPPGSPELPPPGSPLLPPPPADPPPAPENTTVEPAAVPVPPEAPVPPPPPPPATEAERAEAEPPSDNK